MVSTHITWNGYKSWVWRSWAATYWTFHLSYPLGTARDERNTIHTPPPPQTIRLQMFQYFAVFKADVFQLVSLIVIFATKFCPYFLFCYMPATYLVRRSAQCWLWRLSCNFLRLATACFLGTNFRLSSLLSIPIRYLAELRTRAPQHTAGEVIVLWYWRFWWRRIWIWLSFVMGRHVFCRLVPTFWSKVSSSGFLRNVGTCHLYFV